MQFPFEFDVSASITTKGGGGVLVQPDGKLFSVDDCMAIAAAANSQPELLQLMAQAVVDMLALVNSLPSPEAVQGQRIMPVYLDPTDAASFLRGFRTLFERSKPQVQALLHISVAS
jgi:hypothetical protein